MFRIEVSPETETSGSKLSLTFVNDETADVSQVPIGSILTFPDSREIERKAKLAAIFWPQPEDNMGKAPLVILRREGDGAIFVKNLTQISLCNV